MMMMMMMMVMMTMIEWKKRNLIGGKARGCAQLGSLHTALMELVFPDTIQNMKLLIFLSMVMILVFLGKLSILINYNSMC